MIKEDGFEELIESAYRHMESELGLEHVKPSLRSEFQTLQKAHDAIHEFMILAPLLIALPAGREPAFEEKSAFLTYHWEAFHHTHRSLNEALCAYYNVAFVLLRVTFELLLKGAFWECLSHKKFCNNSQVLDVDKAGKKIKRWLEAIFQQAPDVEEASERVSAGIHDKVGLKLEDQNFRPSVKTIVRQLDGWGIFRPIPNAEVWVYSDLYGKLSADVHVTPERIDIGKRLVHNSSDLFEHVLLPDALCEYAGLLHRTMDLAIVVELNIMEDLIGQYEEPKLNLRTRLNMLEQLELEYSFKRAHELLGSVV